jgi:hypothetical protein
VIKETFTLSPDAESDDPDEHAESTSADTATSAISALRVNFDFIYFPPIGVRVMQTQASLVNERGIWKGKTR